MANLYFLSQAFSQKHTSQIRQEDMRLCFSTPQNASLVEQYIKAALGGGSHLCDLAPTTVSECNNTVENTNPRSVTISTCT